MSLRQDDGALLMRELAQARRKQRAELRAYQLKVIAEHLNDAYDAREIAQRLGISIWRVWDLMAELKRRGS